MVIDRVFGAASKLCTDRQDLHLRIAVNGLVVEVLDIAAMRLDRCRHHLIRRRIRRVRDRRLRQKGISHATAHET
jgi:hypothetical protein